VGRVNSKKPDLAASSDAVRRAGLTVLVAGAVLSVAAAFGTIWIVRAGVGIAVMAGIVACVLAWRQTRRQREAALAEQRETMRRHAQAASEQRQQHEEVLTTLMGRNDALRGHLRDLRIKHADLLIELNALRGDKNALTDEVSRAADEIARLRVELAAVEAELAADGEADADAEVLSLPRRVGRRPETAHAEQDLFPTVIDLQALALPFVEEVKRDHA
jgi:hypothetical protein